MNGSSSTLGRALAQPAQHINSRTHRNPLRSFSERLTSSTHFTLAANATSQFLVLVSTRCPLRRRRGVVSHKTQQHAQSRTGKPKPFTETFLLLLPAPNAVSLAFGSRVSYCGPCLLSPSPEHAANAGQTAHYTKPHYNKRRRTSR